MSDWKTIPFSQSKLHPDLDRVDAKHRHLFQAEKVNHFEHVYYKNSFKILAKFD